MSEFATRVKVRHYELDTLGHLNHAVYHQYAEIARLEWFESVGGGGNGLVDGEVSPVMLQTRARFHRELRAGDEVDISCEVSFGGDSAGKTY
ncbi:MAG: acyl-CoA thioesterase, partial [Thermocrispum sp.]